MNIFYILLTSAFLISAPYFFFSKKRKNKLKSLEAAVNSTRSELNSFLIHNRQILYSRKTIDFINQINLSLLEIKKVKEEGIKDLEKIYTDVKKEFGQYSGFDPLGLNQSTVNASARFQVELGKLSIELETRSKEVGLKIHLYATKIGGIRPDAKRRFDLRKKCSAYVESEKNLLEFVRNTQLSQRGETIEKIRGRTCDFIETINIKVLSHRYERVFDQ